MLKVVQDPEASKENTASSSLLDEIVRDGARQMLATALQAEVIAYVEAFADEVDEHGGSSSRGVRGDDSLRISLVALKADGHSRVLVVITLRPPGANTTGDRPDPYAATPTCEPWQLWRCAIVQLARTIRLPASQQ
jgi:hypothetical protein